MTGQDGNAVITVECADSEDTHSPNDLEKVCKAHLLYMLILHKMKMVCHFAQLIIVYKHTLYMYVHRASVRMIRMCC